MVMSEELQLHNHHPSGHRAGVLSHYVKSCVNSKTGRQRVTVRLLR